MPVGSFLIAKKDKAHSPTAKQLARNGRVMAQHGLQRGREQGGGGGCARRRQARPSPSRCTSSPTTGRARARPLAATTLGPVMVYMSKVDDATTESKTRLLCRGSRSTSRGLRCYRRQQNGAPTPSTQNCGKRTFTIPSNIPAGETISSGPRPLPFTRPRRLGRCPVLHELLCKYPVRKDG